MLMFTVSSLIAPRTVVRNYQLIIYICIEHACSTANKAAFYLESKF